MPALRSSKQTGSTASKNKYNLRARDDRIKSPKTITQKRHGNCKNKNKEVRASTSKTTKKQAADPYPLEEAKTLLHTSCLPDTLINREEECKVITRFIKNGFNASNTSSRILYISGVPGTGKTASVLNVVKDIKLPKFNFANVNGLELSDPRMLYQIVYRVINKGMTGAMKKISFRESERWLEDYFSNDPSEEKKRRRKPLLILVDEVDMLYSKREAVVYTIFNWACIEQSRCCVIAISNTLDLAERNFSQRIASRMGTNRLIFQPYEFEQIEAIIQYRIKACPQIANKAIELTAKKIAAISGDLRKSLEILRHAIDIALEECEESGLDPADAELDTKHVLEAIRESTSSSRLEFIQALPKHEELIFRALVKDLYESALEETNFSRVLHKYKQLCISEGLLPLPLSGAFYHIEELAQMHLVILAQKGGELHRRVQLGFSLSEAQFCIRQLDSANNNPLCTTPSSSTPKSTPNSPSLSVNASTTNRRVSRKISFE